MEVYREVEVYKQPPLVARVIECLVNASASYTSYLVSAVLSVRRVDLDQDHDYYRFLVPIQQFISINPVTSPCR
jgi:hypothetical protein